MGIKPEITIVTAILEIANGPNGEPRNAASNAESLLRRCSIAGRPVLGVISHYEEPAQVPAFGYDYRMAALERKGQAIEAPPWGVTRHVEARRIPIEPSADEKEES